MIKIKVGNVSSNLNKEEIFTNYDCYYFYKDCPNLFAYADCMCIAKARTYICILVKYDFYAQPNFRVTTSR